MIDLPLPSDIESYKIREPMDSAKIMVSAGWEFMTSPDANAQNYEIAYALNLGGYMSGHPEGASNIGLLLMRNVLSSELHHLVCNGYDAIDVAEAWFTKALEGKFHSPQAEICLAKIVAARPFRPEVVQLTEKYIYQAIKNANNPDSLWADQKDDYLQMIDMIAAETHEYFMRFQSDATSKEKIH